MNNRTLAILAIIGIVAFIAIGIMAIIDFAKNPGTEPSNAISTSVGFPESEARGYIKLENATFLVAGLNDNGTTVAVSLLDNPDNQTFVIRFVELIEKQSKNSKNFRTFQKISKRDTTVSFNFSSFNSDDFLLEGLIFVDEGEKHPDTTRDVRFSFDVYRKGIGEDIIFWHQRLQPPQEPGFEAILFIAAISLVVIMRKKGV